jgi:putative endonuclease
MKAPVVYILASERNGTLYIGVTSDLIQRIWQHREGVVEGFTQQYAVKTLVWYEQHETMDSAITREKTLKKWNRDWKLRLIEERNPDWNDLWFEITGQMQEQSQTDTARHSRDESRHSREGGNPAQAHVQSTQTKVSATHNEPTGFPPKARGNDGALVREGEV